MVVVIGFSQRTWKPASRNALAISKWVKFGVAMVTRLTLIRLRPRPLAFEHRAPVSVRPLVRHPEPAGVLPPALGIDVDRAGRES